MKIRKKLLLDPAAVDVVVGEKGTRDTPGVKSRTRAEKDVRRIAPELADLQERLFAEGKAGGKRRLVVVLQGTDASGKDGAVKHVLGAVNPAGVQVTSFGKPTEEELAHDFLWRTGNALPPPGQIGVFNRSHYEDVLVVRVHDLVPPAEWEQRYELINAWEAEQAAAGVTFLKVFLHISYEEQRERLLARIDDPRKHWKVNPHDLVERALWEDYRTAYAEVFRRCSTDVAPWYVIPADRKWYRNFALAHLLLETLREMDPQWPVRPELDLDGMRSALRGTAVTTDPSAGGEPS
jgi:PPK2 family polyphosphate:nucleotide phosphotransferase